MDIRVGDTLVMKKTHPCGSNRWQAIQNRQQQYALAVLFSFFKFYNIF